MNDTKVLVTGGAGYVGSHTCLALAEAGFVPVTYDNLSNGHAQFAQWGPLELGDINDAERLAQVFVQYDPVAVLHFAALIEVGEAAIHPNRFYKNNVGGAVTLIDAAMAHGVDKFVFSSTCATYGNPEYLPLDEAHPQTPLNAYGRSKLMVEQILSDYSDCFDFRSVSLRYFNACGADPKRRIGERHTPETHAIPLAILTALGVRERFSIFGTDYETRDGTAVRDYVHVTDLADAHVRALSYLLDGGATTCVNLGTGTGTTVSELVQTIRRRTNANFTVDTASRRSGDSPCLVARNDRARDVLGWQPSRTIDDIIDTAWAWHLAELTSSTKAKALL